VLPLTLDDVPDNRAAVAAALTSSIPRWVAGLTDLDGLCRLAIERDEEDARREAVRERARSLPGSVNYPASWPVEAKEASR
jgi:hypothetical protein